MVLVERAHHGGPDGQLARLVEVAAGEEPQRGLVQDRLGGRREPPALGEQPRLERLGVLEADPVEEVVAETGQPRPRRSSARATSTSTSTVVPGGQRDPDRVAVEDGRRRRGRDGSPPGTTAARRSGSSASAKRSDASWLRVGGRSPSSRNASSAQLLRLR